jgi:tetratricopeptide (TPR) repeat protein
MVNIALQILERMRSGSLSAPRLHQFYLEYACAITSIGLLDVDLGRPALALPRFQEALAIRRKECDPDYWSIAVSISNIGSAYAEMGEFDRAMKCFQEAYEFRKRINCRLLDNCRGDIVALLIRMGKPKEAEAVYNQPSTQKQLEAQNRPRDSE